jgi:hypothetical protein
LDELVFFYFFRGKYPLSNKGNLFSGGTRTMPTEHNIRLTSAELADLWTTYLTDSMTICVVKHFIAKVQDTQIRPILEFALNLSEKHIQQITDIYRKEGHSIPVGFTDKDVNVDVPALYSDTYYLNYIHNMSKICIKSL